jgi:hypothetical protein
MPPEKGVRSAFSYCHLQADVGCASTAASRSILDDPEKRAEMLLLAKMWMSLTEPLGDLPGAYEFPQNDSVRPNNAYHACYRVLSRSRAMLHQKGLGSVSGCGKDSPHRALVLPTGSGAHAYFAASTRELTSVDILKAKQPPR